MKPGAQPNIFLGRWFCGTSELWKKPSLKKRQGNRVTQGKIVECFLLDTLKTIFWMENVIQKLTQSETFFRKLGHHFSIFKKASSCECGWICINIPEYA